MMHLALLACIACIGHVTADPFDIATLPDCGRQTQGTVLVSGEQVTDGELPWLVNVFYHDPKTRAWTSTCQATLISATHVIAHARFVSYDDNDVVPSSKLRLAAGKHVYDLNATEPNVQWRDVSSVIRHENFDQNLSAAFNIALLVSSGSFSLNEFVMPACIDWSGQLPAPTASDVLIVAAWKRGIHDKTIRLIAPQRHSVVSDRNSCNASSKEANRQYIKDDTLCVVSVGSETCDDVQGAGMTLSHPTPEGDKHYLLGFYSHWLYATKSDDWCYTDIGKAVTNLTPYIAWIRENL